VYFVHDKKVIKLSLLRFVHFQMRLRRSLRSSSHGGVTRGHDCLSSLSIKAVWLAGPSVKAVVARWAVHEAVVARWAVHQRLSWRWAVRQGCHVAHNGSPHQHLILCIFSQF
jgi:hypothetical protein